MAKIAFTNKVQSVVNPAAEINKVTADNVNEIKASINHLYDALGWERYFDETHTEGSPQTLTALEDNQITIDGASSIVNQTPVITHNPLWSANEIKPIKSGDTYDLRIDFKAKISNADGYFEMSIDVGGEIGKVVIDTIKFRKGANTEQRFAVVQKIYAADTFFANGGSLLVNPSHTMQIYDKSIFIERTFEGR